MDNAMTIAVTEARESCRKKKSLVQKVKSAMEVTKHHWLVTNEGSRFNAAMAVVMLESNIAEKVRLQTEITALNNLNAVLSGIPVELDKINVPKKLLGLMKIWGGIE